MEEKAPTGYPSIDKPWLKYYSQKQIEAPLPVGTAYEYMYANNQLYSAGTAINYYDHKISYQELFERIEEAAKAFYALGVRKGDIVIVCTVNTPEMVYTLYGLNRLGAVSNFVDPRTNPDALREYINECNCKLVVTIDKAYPLVKQAIPDSTASQVVLISPADSLPGMKKAIYSVKNCSPKLDASAFRWSEFLQKGQTVTPEYAPYEENMPAIMAHTGGTTGVSKTVVLSNENINAVAHGYRHFLGPIKSRDRLFNDLPPFIVYGLSFATHSALCRNLEVILIPKFDSKEFPRLFVKYKPQIVSAVSDHFKHLITSPLTKRIDLSFVVATAIGGDSMDVKLERQVNQFYHEHGTPFELYKGYGMSELGSGAITSMNQVNALGSVGIPLVNNTMKVMDSETSEECTYNKIGEIWISGPSLMLEYYKNPKATAETIITDEQGIRWIKTGDLGYITEDGLLYHKGRIRRIYLTFFEGQPAKIFPSLVEEKIIRSERIKECCVVGRKQAKSEGYEAVAFLALAQEIPKEALVAELKALCKQELPSYMWPAEYRIVEKLPLTPIGKVDFRKLEEMAAEQ